MFPFIWEWLWDAGHLIFFGGMWYAVSILGLGMTYCITKSIIDTSKGQESHHGH